MSPVHNSILNAFHDKALRASQIGGALNVDSHGGFTIDGKNWLGRKVLWLKQRLFPNRMRRQNMKVLATLAKTLHEDLGVRGASRLMKREFGVLAGTPQGSRLLAERLASAVESYDRVLERQVLKEGSGVYKQADQVFDEFLRPERDIRQNLRLLRSPREAQESPYQDIKGDAEKTKPLRVIESKPEGWGADREIAIRNPQEEARRVQAQEWDYENMSETEYANLPSRDSYRNPPPSRLRQAEEEHIYEPIPGARTPLLREMESSEEAPHDYVNAQYGFSRPAEPKGISAHMGSLLSNLGADPAQARLKILPLRENYNLFVSKLSEKLPAQADSNLYLNPQGALRQGFMQAAFLVMLKEEGVIQNLPQKTQDIGLRNPQDLPWLQSTYRAISRPTNPLPL